MKKVFVVLIVLFFAQPVLAGEEVVKIFKEAYETPSGAGYRAQNSGGFSHGAGGDEQIRNWEKENLFEVYTAEEVYTMVSDIHTAVIRAKDHINEPRKCLKILLTRLEQITEDFPKPKTVLESESKKEKDQK